LTLVLFFILWQKPNSVVPIPIGLFFSSSFFGGVLKQESLAIGFVKFYIKYKIGELNRE
jgi:hypothetical protein